MKVDVVSLLANAARLLQRGDLWQAQTLCQQLLQSNPKHPDGLHLLGLIHAQAGRHDEAVRLIGESLQANPNNLSALNNRAVSLKKLARFEEALASCDRAIELKHDYVDALVNRGNVLLELKRFEEALASFDTAIALRPDFAVAHNNRGNALVELQRHEEALASFDRAIAVKRDYAEAYNNRGNALFGLRRLEEALVSYERAIALRQDYAEAHNNRGNALVELKRSTWAIASYDRAIALNAGYAEAHKNRGNALLELRRFDEALASYDKAITLRSDYADAYYDRGQALLKARRYADAIASFESLLKIDPQFPFAAGNLLHAKALCCDWRGFDELRASIASSLHDGKRCVEPFGYQGVADSEEDLFTCARIFAASEFPPTPALARRGPAADAGRITIGYLCGEFREQATTILMCGVFESHDRDRFRLIAFDNGWDDGSDYRRRVVASFDELIDITRLSDLEVAQLIRKKEVDVLVNLNGYFGEARLGVFAYRPSPVQVNYLGFPGTIGVDYIDYLIADRIVIPEDSRRHYAEKIVYLPDCYQANDAKRVISDRKMSRSEFGLPDDGFVFCCFNNNYKITPQTFDVWMRILQRVDNGVLWLLEDNPHALDNLQREAAQRGTSGRKLIFAGRMPLSEHLARHRLADLFLDTLPYNAHTTASDALWAGLPVLTIVGTTFPGRVAASLLNAIDLPELVTTNREEYENLAVELASNPERLRSIRERLERNRLTRPLFDTSSMARRLEAAYAQMLARYRAGLAPEHFSIAV